MMTIEDYELDVGKTIDEIKALCDKIGINYEDEKTPLDETDIILLDNEQQDAEDYITGDIEDLETKDYEEEVSDKAESCPHCGYSFKKKIEINDDKLKELNGKWNNKYLIIILIVLVIGYFLFFNGSKTNNTNTGNGGSPTT